MLTAYEIINGILSSIEGELHAHDSDRVVWIDLISPSPEEIRITEKLSGFSLPEIKETEEIEASSHYEIYQNGFQVNCLFMKSQDNSCDNINVAFLCNQNILVSICGTPVLPVNVVRAKCTKFFETRFSPLSILIELLELKVEQIADLSEESCISIEKISKLIFQRESTDLEESIDCLSQQDDINGKIRICLMDGQRDFLFLLRKTQMLEEQTENIKDLLEDIKTLLNHNNFLSERIDFLLNAALGFINIEQNKIIKIFSIAAVVLMPPTVIASIYGMNFHHMPELSWKWGYPVSILSMVIAGISPYIYFKRKGWL